MAFYGFYILETMALIAHICICISFWIYICMSVFQFYQRPPPSGVFTVNFCVC